MKTRSIHYKVEIGKDGRVFYCDSLNKAMRWLNIMLNTEFLSVNDIRSYNKCHNYDQVFISNVNMPISEFYERRRTYMNAVNKASAFMERAQRTENRKKRTERLNIFSRYYELANIVAVSSGSMAWGDMKTLPFLPTKGMGTTFLSAKRNEIKE